MLEPLVLGLENRYNVERNLSLCCCNTSTPQTGQLMKNRNLFFTIMDAANFKTSVLPGSLSVDCCFLQREVLCCVMPPLCGL